MIHENTISYRSQNDRHSSSAAYTATCSIGQERSWIMKDSDELLTSLTVLLARGRVETRRLLPLSHQIPRYAPLAGCEGHPAPGARPRAGGSSKRGVSPMQSGGCIVRRVSPTSQATTGCKTLTRRETHDHRRSAPGEWYDDKGGVAACRERGRTRGRVAVWSMVVRRPQRRRTMSTSQASDR